LTPFKRGDYVDIKVDPSQQKGMPYNYYHGRTGVVFNVNKNAVGVEVTKVVGNRQLRKRLHIRVVHVRRSRCNDDFLRRVKENDVIKTQAKKEGKKVVTKRQPILPKAGKTVKTRKAEQEVFAPVPFIANYF
jgi:large subunit ribosomal protein L21e